jgi:gliding motility-associated transport system ATP-binding protein
LVITLVLIILLKADKFPNVMGLEVKGIKKLYGPLTAVDSVSFQISVPSVVGFLGPNGAGKTTTMRMITGYLAPTEGEIRIDGENAGPDNSALHAKIGYLPESNPLYTELEVHEYLKFAAQLSGLDSAKTSERLAFVVERCGLQDVLYDPIYRLSKGYKQRVGLAQAIIHDPSILVLDEPTSGLDPNQVIGIRQLISELANEKFVVLSTHILSEVQALCDRVLIINRGKLVLDATADELRRTGTSGMSVLVKSGLPPENLAGLFRTALGVDQCSARTDGDAIRLEIAVKDSHEMREKAFDTCVRNNLKMLELTNSGSNLENIFRELTLGADETGQQP